MDFVHVPKNAGTAITLAKGMEFQMEGHHKWTEYQSCLGKEKWEEYFKFSVIRNAWDRLYSSYKYARMPKSYWHSNDSSTRYPKHVDYDLCSRLDFEECVRLLWKQPSFFKHMAWGPQYPYVCDSNHESVLDRIFMHDRLDDANFSEIIPSLERINVSTGGDVSYTEVYTEELVEIVKEIYAKDIEIFQMEFREGS